MDPIIITIPEANKQWIENEKEKGKVGFTKNCTLLITILAEKKITGPQIYGFLKNHNIKANGCLSKNNEISKLFMSRFNMTQEQFFVGTAQQFWTGNAANKDYRRNKLVLKALTSDTSISDGKIFEFLYKNRIKPEGNFIQRTASEIAEQRGPQFVNLYSLYCKELEVASKAPMPAPPRHWVNNASDVDPTIPSNTANAYKVSNTRYKNERYEIHKTIKSEIIGKANPVPLNKKPVAMVMMGPPGAGKSTCIDQIIKGSDQFVEVGLDNVMERMPEYKKAINLGTDDEGRIITAKDACLITRDEANDITSSLRDEVISTRRNLIYDGTGQSYPLYAKMINKLKSDGYDVQVYYLDIDLDEAQKRAKNRAEAVGRLIPEDVIESIHTKAKANFYSIAALAHTGILMDSRSFPPKEVCKFEGGELVTGAQYLADNDFKKFVG